MKAKSILIASFVFSFLLTCCSSRKEKEIAEKGVDQFHTELDSEQYHVMYAAADEDLQSGTTEIAFAGLLRAVHRKLGNVQHSQLRNFEFGWFTGQGTVVTLVYDTTFVGGAGTEQFVWHIREKRPLLSGYHINSDALIEK